MAELTIVTLCQALSNLTHNRCSLIENSNVCQCIGDGIHPLSSTGSVVSSTSEIMLSEVILIFFVLTIWLSAIGFCLNQYKSLRRLETQVHYCVNRKDPLNIGEIKIVTREQDSIIYKKKRYSTLLDTHINTQDLAAMHYVQQYLPKTIPSTISTLVNSRDDLSINMPLSTTTRFDSANNIILSTHHEEPEYQSSIPYYKTDMEHVKCNTKISYMQRTGSARYTTGLTVPHMSPSSSSHSSWNSGRMYETCSTQHLGVPSDTLGSSYYSAADVSLPVPHITHKPSGEQLLDPRLISNTVRRSLLALHRESQENVNMLKKKDQTRSENDVHGVLISLKMKMKSKSKCTQQQYRPHSNTLSILPQRAKNNNEHDRHVLEYLNPPEENQTPTGATVSVTRRGLKHTSKFLTNRTAESEIIQVDSPVITNIYLSTDDDDESTRTLLEKSS